MENYECDYYRCRVTGTAIARERHVISVKSACWKEKRMSAAVPQKQTVRSFMQGMMQNQAHGKPD